MDIVESLLKLKDNPVYLREFYYKNRVNGDKSDSEQKPFTGNSFIFLLIASLLIVFVLDQTWEISKHFTDSLSLTVLSVLMIIGLLMIYKVLFLGSFLITEDKEKQVFSLLMASALKPEEIVYGKFWLVFYPITREFLLYYATIFMSGLIMLELWITLSQTLYFAFVLIIIFRLVLYISLWASARSKTILKARELAQAQVLLNSIVITLVCFFLSYLSRLYPMNFPEYYIVGYEQAYEVALPVLYSIIVMIYCYSVAFLYRHWLIREISRVPDR